MASATFVDSVSQAKDITFLGQCRMCRPALNMLSGAQKRLVLNYVS